MNPVDFLFELGTEELPPKALPQLSAALTASVSEALQQAQLPFTAIKPFASPRRLAFIIQGLTPQQADTQVERRGPALNAAFDGDGKPTKACEGFARSCGVSPDALETLETDKGSWLVYRSQQRGQHCRDLLPGMIDKALASLPIPKRMRWGKSRVEFVRPAHWVVMMINDAVVDAHVLGLPAGNQTRGHRFHAPDWLTVPSATEYEGILANKGYVIAHFDGRKQRIEEGVKAAAGKLGGQVHINPALLDEVTALNEWPVVLQGSFEERFLAVPDEALISSMEEHQKYFHVVNPQGALLPHFITVANIESRDPTQVIQGNERVIRPRLADAAFFFETDKKTPLSERLENLKPIVFQKQLGSLYDKSARVSRLAAAIAERSGGNVAWAEQAGWLSKTDLTTEMVLEFTDLQGLMGYYYAQAEGVDEEVAKALEEQYRPKQAGADLPETATGCALSIADKLDTLVGIFGINQPPTGAKDPFGLRRATLGILRICIERELALNLPELIQIAAQGYQSLPNKNVEADVFQYLLERFHAWYGDAGVAAEVVQAVVARAPADPTDFDERIKAVQVFLKLPAAQSLAAANKRVSNILTKQGGADAELPDKQRLQETAEQDLFEALQAKIKELADAQQARDYVTILTSLAELEPAINRFFDDVMVMAEDMALRQNRVRLLNQLRDQFLYVADISLLPGN